INIIDTPGHVDFTIEVERALRVLDSAVLVLCSVAGVQSQSITVDRQMKRYGVPRIAFVNKCDRQGANPIRVRDQLREKLGHNAVMMQLPIGLEDRFSGVIDLVTMQACYFDGDNGEVVRVEEIPADMVDNAMLYREEMLDTVSMFSDELTEAMLMEDDEPGSVTPEIIHAAIRKATISLQVTPVLMGSAYKNKGVQKLLDAVVNWLAAPNEVPNHAFDLDNDEARVEIEADPTRPAVALAFKLEEGRYGQLTYLRIYEGTIARGMQIINARSGDKVKVGRLVRMHADEMEDIEDATCGDIVAIFGVDCFSGDTFTDGTRRLTMASIHVPDAVISLTINPVDNKASVNMSKAL
ncbi:MAG: GTP-binding protein, partial [Phycisphaerales bacterium]|nr:GTP-binding protein [Phycisphaerales bacterium]